jgi:peroxiredoxin
MKFFKILVVVCIISAFLFFSFWISETYLLPTLLGNNTVSTTPPSQNGNLLGQKAPFFNLPDISGNRVMLTNFLNTPLVIVFWSTWNAEARDQMEILDTYLSQTETDKNLVSFLAIDSQEDASLVKSFMSRGGYSVPIALDVYGDTSQAYGIKNLPTFYFIDRDGIIREIYSGILSQKMIVDKSEQILKQ